MKLSQYTLPICSALFVLMGCQTAPDHPDEMKAALDEAIAEHEKPKTIKPLAKVPTSVQQELMQNQGAASTEGLAAEKRLEIAATDVSAKDFFTAISEGSPYSIAVHPDVEGSITLNLSDVTLTEVLAVVEEIYGYEIRKNKRVIQVYPAGLRTETIALNYLFIKRYGQSNTSINSGGVSGNDQNSGNSNGNNNSNNNNNNSNNNQGSNNSNSNNQMTSGVNISTANESDFWTELKETLTALVGNEPGRTVFVSPQAGLVTIKGMPDEINAVKRFIKDTETHLHRQVVIEAKIMEVTLRDDYQQGILWDQVLDAGSGTLAIENTGNIVGNIVSGAIGGATSITYDNGSDFTSVIELLQTQGNVQVLSSPRITATNNQKAVIKVGEDEYFVTDVSSTTITGTTPTVTPEVDLTPFFSGIALDVTPQINGEDEVILHVHPSVTVTDEQTKTISLGAEEIVLPLAQTNIRESDTVIRAKSGEIVVIGGLIETRKGEIESKIPLLGDIPYLGELFKSKSDTLKKTELVILLKPVVVGQDTWKTQLESARAILTEWFPEEEKDDEEEPAEEEEQTDAAEEDNSEISESDSSNP